MPVVSDIFTKHRKTPWSLQNSPTFIWENIIKRLKETFLTSEWNKNHNHFSHFYVHCYAFGLPFVAVAMPSKTIVQMEESLHNLLWQCPGSSPGQILPKTYNTCKKPHYKLCQNPSTVLKVVENVNDLHRQHEPLWSFGRIILAFSTCMFKIGNKSTRKEICTIFHPKLYSLQNTVDMKDWRWVKFRWAKITSRIQVDCWV